MKKVIVFIVLGVFVGMVCFSSVGCSGKKPEPVDSDSISAISDTTAADTLDQIIAETPMPSAADELFDDFFFNFAANRKLQMKRIVFPLPVIAGKDTTFLPKKRWKMDHFFMHQDFYTLIFDNMKQMNVVKDTTINHVVVERINLPRRYVKGYVFNRIRGEWKMTSIVKTSLKASKNASFLSFYHKFVRDTAFQVRSVNDPLEFTGPNPAANFSGVRYAKIPSRMSMSPEQDADTRWTVVSPSTVRGASATGYFFGRLLSKSLGVPVGLIEANKGGTRVESWLNLENLKANTDEKLDKQSIDAIKTDYYRPLVWGNGTFSPIEKYTVKGIIYYQGCSNVGYHMDDYARRLGLLVTQWRKAFACGDIPFYFVEIAPYWYDDADGTNAAVLREQQYKASKLIKNCGFIGNNDGAYAWEMKQIHPSQKRKVGERLAYRALTDTYGVKGLISKNPTFESLTVNGNEVIVKLSNTDGGIYPLYGIQGFEVAGADGKFHRAAARYDWHDGIIVSSEKVAVPRAVRYCFRNFMLGNARNQGGLPLIPFRATVK